MTTRAGLADWVAAWVRLVIGAPGIAWLVLVLITAAAAWLSAERYSLNSRLTDLVQMESGWRSDWDAYRAAFPQIIDTAVIAVRGDSFGAVEETALALEAAVRERTELFTDVFAPTNSAVLRDHAFLFMSLEQLDDVGDNLAAAQPLLTAVAEDPSLRGLLGVVENAVANGGTEALDRVVPRLLASAQQLLNEADARVRWSDEFFAAQNEDETGNAFYRLIFMRGVQNFGEALPNALIVSRLRELIAAQDLPDGVRVSLTGEAALQHEEFEAAIGGVQLAGTVAFVLLAVVLALGVRSGRIVLATLLLLLVGVTWTTGLAMLTVGEFNTLSLIFLVMFFGLGVDFAIHFSLRLQEGLGTIADADRLRGALLEAARSVGPAIALCSITTAIGFLGFAPTDYQGLADLGVISAGGMLVAGVLTFTLLPLFFVTFGAPGPLPGAGATTSRPLRLGRGATIAVTLALLVGSVATVSRTSFDFSVLALRDPDSESMRTLRELQAEKQLTDYVLFTLTERDELANVKALEALPTVASVRTPLDWVPTEQDDKLFVLEDLQAVLWSALEPAEQRATATPKDNRAAIEMLVTAIETMDSQARTAELDALGATLREIAALDEGGVSAWQQAVTGNLIVELDWLRRALTVDRLAFDDLPEGLRRRLVAPDGRVSSHVIPAQDISQVAHLNEFIASVRERVPDGTGRPVVEWGVGGIVVDSFQTALLLALVGIGLILLLSLRSIIDTLLVMLPLGLAAGLALGVNALNGVPLNMASVLVMPLIFGLGVDNGIHVVERFRRDGNDAAAYRRSSTPRAVLLSALTTIGTFAALMLSPHRGTSSIGELLALAVGLLLLLTLFLLPSLLALTGARANGIGRDGRDGGAAADQPA